MGRQFKLRQIATSGLCVLLLLFAALLTVGLAEAIKPPIRRDMTIRLPQWPTGEPPLRIALLADIHLGNRAMSPARLRTIVHEVNSAHPDLVLIAGDFTVGHTPGEETNAAASLREPLTELNARLGTVAVLGNHDHWTSPESVRTALEEARILVLENGAVRRGPLKIIGIGDAFSGHADIKRALALASGLGGVPLVLTHSPDIVHKLGPGLPIILAGHTHCGQVVLPLIGPVLTRSPFQHWVPLYDPRLLCGAVRDNGRLVIVTAGLGSGTSPIRIGAPPDWWLMTLGSLPTDGSRSP